MKCDKCGRVKATESDWENTPEGGRPDLCWGEWDETECWAEVLDQKELGIQLGASTYDRYVHND